MPYTFYGRVFPFVGANRFGREFRGGISNFPAGVAAFPAFYPSSGFL
jgi:hypothetical protein